tara:strand:+ start:696 stop:893 length:198 start_codon:yes stop_codon:yes gene_type:complete
MSNFHLIKSSDLFDKICLSRSCHTHNSDKDGFLAECWKGNFQFLGPEVAEVAMFGGRRLTVLNHV